jgi:hypothetical protein
MIRAIFFALQITSLLPGVAVLVLPLGDQAVGIQPIHFTLVLALPLILIALIQGNLRIRERTLILVLLFAFFSTISALFYHKELPMTLVGTVGLSPFGQLLYWLFAMTILLLFQSYALSSQGTVAKDWYPFILGAFLISFIGFYQIAAHYLGWPYPANWFNNNPSFLQRYEDTVWGIKRLNATFPEASMYGLASTAALFISLAFRGTWWGVVRFAILISAFLTLSATAFLGVGMFFIWFLVSNFEKTKSPYRKLLFVLVAIVSAIPLVFGLYNVLKLKIDSESGFERYSSFLSGIDLWLQSPLMGWGLGAGRTTDGLSNVLLNFGLVGAILLLLVILSNLFVKIPSRCTSLRSLRAGIMALGVLHLVSNSDIIFPYLWMLLGYISGKVKAEEVVSRTLWVKHGGWNGPREA